MKVKFQQNVALFKISNAVGALMCPQLLDLKFLIFKNLILA